MRLKSIATAALVLAAASANAQSSVNVGALAVGSTASFSFVQAASFLNFDVLFALAENGRPSSGASASATTLSITLKPFLVSSTQTTVTVAGNLYDASNVLIGTDADMADGFSFATLMAGPQYRLNLSSTPFAGASTIAGGGAIGVSAVPEPETYALLLAGLGAVGFMSRRRKSV